MPLLAFSVSDVYSRGKLLLLPACSGSACCHGGNGQSDLVPGAPSEDKSGGSTGRIIADQRFRIRRIEK